ncbi:hypothetical protein DI43_07225 [Geobacillus sp. CAMR12739]|nr:hypothetical protein DI43_07225 [Geobacillus sp. CAMR12739]
MLREWERYCVKAGKVVDAIEKEMVAYQANRKLKRQIHESRKLVAEQLLGVSQVMDDFAKEMQKEQENHYLQEEQIYHALQEFGIEVGHVDIYSLEKGNIDIEMSIPYCEGRGECEKLIAPMLSDILGETIVVKREECAAYPNGYCRVAFGSTKAFVVETGVAFAAKGGGSFLATVMQRLNLLPASTPLPSAMAWAMGSGRMTKAARRCACCKRFCRREWTSRLPSNRSIRFWHCGRQKTCMRRWIWPSSTCKTRRRSF